MSETQIAAPPAEQSAETRVEKAPAPPTWRPAARPRTVLIAAGAGVVIAMLVVLAAWRLPPFDGGAVVTDNAYVRGRTTIIAPQVSGYVVAVPVQDYAHVRAGDVLVRIDDSIYRARVSQARANVAAQIAAITGARAQLARARADEARADDLVRDGSISARERDQTLAALRAAQAQVGNGGSALQAQLDVARAQLRLAEIDLQHTVIIAPESGQVGEVGVRNGQYVTNGSQLVSLVPAQRWVIANYREAQTVRMAPGQRAEFSVDALGGAHFTGHVDQISPAAGSEFSVLRPDNATGNFVKVPQRIGVRIAIDPRQPMLERLRPGMSVEARIDTSHTP